jgi:hypothetical protein
VGNSVKGKGGSWSGDGSIEVVVFGILLGRLECYYQAW